MRRSTLFLIGALITFLATPDVFAATILFQVAELPGREVHSDSYVLPLSDPGDIQHARDLIALGPGIGETIVVANIAAGSDGINRDLLAPGAPLWSWHVTEFVGFSDFTIEILDGWPGFVEADVEGWIQNTGGAIGFWNYTVVAELRSIPIPAPGPLPSFLTGLIGLLVTSRFANGLLRGQRARP